MKNILPVFLLFFSSIVLAIPEEEGNIGLLQIHQDPNSSSESAQRYIVGLEGTISESNCGTDYWTGYLKSDADKASYSTLLALYMAGKPVKLQGTSADTCMGNGVLIRNVFPR